MSETSAGVDWILGASGGIGSALARQLAAAGRRVVLGGRSAERLEPLANELSAPAVELEATDSASVDAAADHIESEFGPLRSVTNCVGSIKLRPAHATTSAQFAECLLVNLHSAFHVVRTATKRMMKSGDGGSIVLMSTAAATVGLTNHEAIAAAKAGIEGLARSAAATYAPRGIRVNAVAPGLVRTKLAERLLSNEASAKASAAMHPLGRVAEPGEVAAAIEWLLDPRSEFVTGQVIGVDGGLAHVRGRTSG